MTYPIDGLPTRVAATRQEQLAAQQRLRTVVRQEKEETALANRQSAALEVAVFEEEIAGLLSIHRKKPLEIDWKKLAATLLPHEPSNFGLQDFWRQTQEAQSAFAGSLSAAQIDQAPAENAESQRIEMTDFAQEKAESLRLRRLAHRILREDLAAFAEAIEVFPPCGEVAGIGAMPRVEVASTRLLTCDLVVRGRDAVPTEVKVLTSGGKLSTKPMAKVRYHALYQDYVCSCVLRAGRDLFALLPVRSVLTTAYVQEETDAQEIPVLSVALTRPGMEPLDFQNLDPSDTMATFQHRGDVMASRRTGMFSPIVPLAVDELSAEGAELPALQELRRAVRREQLEITERLTELRHSLGKES